MASLNRVIVMGNLGQDPELRYTQNQTPVCTLSIATTDYRTGQDGQRQENTEWHRVVVWSRQAENCAKYLAKGRSVLVEGRLQTRSWEDKQGQKRYVTEIVAQNVQFVGGGQRDRSQPSMGSQTSQQQGYEPTAQPMTDTSMGGSPKVETATGLGGSETPGLDDIPF